MTTNEAYTLIATNKPSVICVSGKTSTGKSTFSKKLHDELNYGVIGIESQLIEIAKETWF